MDPYKKHGCEFKNEAECEEELDEAGISMQEAETKHFDQDEKELK